MAETVNFTVAVDCGAMDALSTTSEDDLFLLMAHAQPPMARLPGSVTREMAKSASEVMHKAVASGRNFSQFHFRRHEQWLYSEFE